MTHCWHDWKSGRCLKCRHNHKDLEYSYDGVPLELLSRIEK